MQVQETAVQTDRLLTLPNALSVVRLLAIPVFVWLALGPQEDGAAALVLVGIGFTDWADGFLARRWNQITRFGQLVDPIADRLATLTTLLVFLIRGVVPWWLVVILVARDAVLALEMSRLKARGVTGLPVNFVGKAATATLLGSFPLLLWGAQATSGALELIYAFGWSLALWGVGLYLYSGALYLRQGRAVRAQLPAPAAG
jgi:cardiolipin synthase (CMP-forming)